MIMQLEDPRYFEIVPRLGEHYIEIHSNNGMSTIWFYPMGKEGDQSKFIHTEFDWAWIDEAVQCNEQVCKLFYPSRLSGKNGPRRIWYTTHSGGAGHWLKLWADEMGWRHIKMSTHQNQLLPEGYLTAMTKGYVGMQGVRYIEGEWVDLEDVFFDYTHYQQWESGYDFVVKTVAFCDPAMKNDYTAIVVMQVTDAEKYIIRAIKRVKGLSVVQHADLLKKVNEEWKPHVFQIETNGQGHPIWDYAHRNGVPNLGQKITKEDKETRALAWQAVWENKHIWFATGQLDEKQIVQEICAFPNAQHDDVVDAISGCYELLRGGAGKQTLIAGGNPMAWR